MLCGGELRQFVHVGCDEFAELEQRCGALGQGDVAPGDSGRLGRSDGRVKIRLAGQPQLCGDGAGGGVVDGLGVGSVLAASDPLMKWLMTSLLLLLK